MNLWNRIKSWFSGKESTDKPYEYYYEKISKYNGIVIPIFLVFGSKVADLQFWLREDGVVTLGEHNYKVLHIDESPKAFRIYFAYDVNDGSLQETTPFITIFK